MSFHRPQPNMTLGERLRQCRNHAGLIQEAVAQQVSAPRELISMWENDIRVPSRRQLDKLAKILLVTKEYLLGIEESTGSTMEQMLFRHHPNNALSQEVRKGINEWTGFLTDWSEFLGDEASGNRRPLRDFDRDIGTTDVRRASSLATKVRKVYALGQDALPNMYTFLDKQGVLVYRSSTLASYNRDDGISGAFYNHPNLGFCILVNAATTLGRQTFTLAHEFAHALFHYSEKGLISSSFKPTSANNRSEYASFERFADAFAAHFLVPATRLRILWKAFRTEEVVPSRAAVMLAAHFRVSYIMLLFRLLNEGLIAPVEFTRCREISPSTLAEQMGLDVHTFLPRKERIKALDRFPACVLDRVTHAIREEGYGITQAAGLLGTDDLTIKNKLLGPLTKAKRDESRALLREFREYPYTNYAVRDEINEFE